MIPDLTKIRNYFDLSDNAIIELTKRFGIEPAKVFPKIKPIQETAVEYQALLDNHTFGNKAELARHFGVSRAWVTKALKVLKQ